MALHEVSLKGYNVRPGNLSLGTFGSYGIEQLHVTLDDNKMAIKSKARHDLTLRSIKREIGAGRDVAFWLDKAYTHYDNGLLDEADISEVETLAQAYYDAVDARKSADKVTETPDVPEVDGAENTTDE